jgi:two-component system, NtrC family, response regulator AtoC
MANDGVILIVDDDALIVELLRTYLTGLGYQTDVAMTGGEALMLVELNRPDAVILDLKLPDLSGAEILRRLRSADATIPVLMLTGNTDEGVARGLLKAGALDYICKPVRLEILETAVTTAVSVGRQRPRRGVVLQFPGTRRADEHRETSNRAVGQASM